MTKKKIWIVNAALALTIAALLYGHYGRSSGRPYERALVRVADAVQKYRDGHGRMPSTLTELEKPELLSFRGAGVEYTNADVNFVLSILVPNECGPKIDPGKLPVPVGAHDGRLVSTRISMAFRKDTK